MNTHQKIEDILVCIQEGRKPRDYGPYTVQVGDQDLNFGGVIIDDPMPTGRQIIEAAGIRKAEEHLVFQVLRNGELEELNLEETTDLRAATVERFLIFHSAASYRFDIDGKRLEWGYKVISGRVLKRLAGVDATKFGVWLEVRGEEDRPIADNELVRLDGEGLEHFFTGICETTEGGAS
ncbi:multiubiquitin domain-containing protein [Acuticoccus yangtzensis]|uniref:multiubiquitin domain-containing protein n=1 Tax=Acuticoccus yangtzensis TaxID=1443441 RepID=UPI000D3E6C61|nr:multiubiquitin domain-containing protein [Acuticoccus yangtzensis]